MKEINKKRIIAILKIVKFLCTIGINHLQGNTTVEEMDSQLAVAKNQIDSINNKI